MEFISTKYEKLRRVPEYAKDAAWEFHVTTEHSRHIDGILRLVDIEDDIIVSNPAGTSWQARRYENTPWAEPAATREEAIQNLLKIGRSEQQSQEAETDPTVMLLMNKLWGTSVSEDGFVVPVDPADMKSACKLGRETADGPAASFAIGMDAYKSVLQPGANPTAVWYRVKMLGICDLSGLLEAYKRGGQYTDAVFRVGATFPMKKMEVGVTYHGPPFDVDEFLKQVERVTAG